LKEVIKRLLDEGMRGLILDVRGNPGGLLSSAVDTCDLFISGGDILSTKDRYGRVNRVWEASAEGTFPLFPMVVLIDSHSASASEIVAACLQDYRRAVVVGERSWGKGTVQELFPLSGNNGMMKLTTASYWSPNHQKIHRGRDDTEESVWGVHPNKGYEVELTEAQRRKLLEDRFLHGKPRRHGEPPVEIEDSQLDRALEYFDSIMPPR